MKIMNTQSLATGEGQTYSAEKLVELGDSANGSEMEDSDQDCRSLKSEPRSVVGFEPSDSIHPDSPSIPSPSGCDIAFVDDNSMIEGSFSWTPQGSPDGENSVQLTDCSASPNSETKLMDGPASPDSASKNSEIESPESPDENADGGKLLDSPASSDVEENGEVLESPESPDPVSPLPTGSPMKVRIESDDDDGAPLILNSGILASCAQDNSALNVKPMQSVAIADSDEDWEAEADPNPPFPKPIKPLEVARIIAMRKQNKSEVESSGSLKLNQVTEHVQYGGNSGVASEGTPHQLKRATMSRYSEGSRNEIVGNAAVNRPKYNTKVGSYSGCYNCKGDHRWADCPLPPDRDLIQKRRHESKRNANQRYFNGAPPQSRYAPYKPGNLEHAEGSAPGMENSGGDSVTQPQLGHSQLMSFGNSAINLKPFPIRTPQHYENFGIRDKSVFPSKPINVPDLLPIPNFKLLPTPMDLATSRFSSSLLGYDRPAPYFNPLPVQDEFQRASKVYNDLVAGKRISPGRDIVAEVERTGNYCYKVSEKLEKMDEKRKAEEARKEKELLASSVPQRKKRCRSPSLLEQLGASDFENSLNVDWSRNSGVRNRVSATATSTVTSSVDDDDDCKIIGEQRKGDKPPLATIVIDSDDDVYEDHTQPLCLPNPLFKKQKIMNEEQVEDKAASSKQKDWADFLAANNVILENANQNSQDIQFIQEVPKAKTYLHNTCSTSYGSTQGSQVKGNERIRDNQMNAPPQEPYSFTTSNNGFSPRENGAAGRFRLECTDAERDADLRLIRSAIRRELTEEKKDDDDDDDIQIIE